MSYIITGFTCFILGAFAGAVLMACCAVASADARRREQAGERKED